MQISRLVVVVGLLLAGWLGSQGARAHGGEVHADEGHAPVQTWVAAPRTFAQSEVLEVVAVLDEAAQGGRQLSLTVDHFATNEPVTGARLEIETDGQADVKAKEVSPGLYVVQLPPLAQAKPGAHVPLTVWVESGEVSDLLSMTLEMPAAVDHADAHDSGWTAKLIWVLGGVAALGVSAVWLMRRRRQAGTVLAMWLVWLVLLVGVDGSQAWAHGGEDHGEEPARSPVSAAVGRAMPSMPDKPQRLADGALFVPKSVQRQLGIRTMLAQSGKVSAVVELNGTIIADPQTSGRVQAPFAGVVEPGAKGMPLRGRTVTRGEVLVHLRPVASAMDMGNQRSQLVELEGQLAVADRKAKRYAQLEGVVPQKDIDAARIEREALRQRRAHVAASVGEAVALRAPVGGVISASHHLVAGQIVDARDILFEIVEPSRLAVEALAYDPGRVSAIQSASALTGQATLPLDFLGGGRQLRAQALPLLFRIRHPNDTLAVGQAVKVVVQTSQSLQGTVVPIQALTRNRDGATVVWVHAQPERFVARTVHTQPVDTTRVAVIDGLHDGDRVVSVGASLLSQVR